MKICYLANASSIHTFRWVSYFAEKGNKISIISLREASFDYQGIEVFWIKKIRHSPVLISHLINFLPIIFQLWRVKKRIKADVFHALGSSNGWLAAFVGFCPLIFTIADPGILPIPFQRKLPSIYKIFNKYGIKKSDLLVCDGENVKKAMIELKADPQKIKIIRYGIDLDMFKPKEADEEFKEKIFNRNAKIVISTKPLRKECGVEVLVKAIPFITKEVPEARFLLIGDGEEKEKLKSLANSLKISELIKFTGHLSPKNLPFYLNLADVFVCTSLVETGLASSVAEAMACELPIVVSDSGDNRILIKKGENGFIFPLKDSKTLAEKIILLLKDENLRKKFAKANRKFIEEKNNYYKEMEKMENLYKELINER